MNRIINKNRAGFTLLELLVVIGIIGILAAIVIVAINPGRQFAQARNAQRWNDVNAVLNAVHQYAVDNNGTIPAAITLVVTNIGDTGVDICSQLVPTYITAIPADPKTGSYTNCTSYDSKYSISKDANGRVKVEAPGVESPATSISVTR